MERSKLTGILGIVASVLGLFFSGFSTYDYAAHLDRELHETHCSFIPGLLSNSEGANPCTAALQSPYSALFRASYWGGIPISLFALGSYVFFLAFSVYFLMGSRDQNKSSIPRSAWFGFSVATLLPFLATVVMFFVSLTQLGAFCKLCVGMYTSSLILVVAGYFAYKLAFAPSETSLNQTMPMHAHGHQAASFGPPPGTRKEQSAKPGLLPWVPASLGVLALCSVLPGMVYASSVPDYRSKIVSCGKMTERTEKHNALLKFVTASPKRDVTIFEDPLCPTCKGFHDRLITEGIYENLNVSSSMFPLDNECNWMIDRSLHAGACMLSRAVICGEKMQKSREVLEWSYKNQEELFQAGKTNKDLLRAKIRAQYPDLDACIDSKETKARLDRMLQFAVSNKLPIRTPQFFLGDQQICDEDTDLGLKYTLKQLAPEVLP